MIRHHSFSIIAIAVVLSVAVVLVPGTAFGFPGLPSTIPGNPNQPEVAISLDIEGEGGGEAIPCAQSNDFVREVSLAESGGRMSDVAFVPNHGQMQQSVHFSVSSGSETFWFTDREVVIGRRYEDAASGPVRLSFVGSDSEVMKGIDILPGRVNFFRSNNPGKWVSNVPTYSGVKHENLYTGIDLVFRKAGSGLKSEFTVSPGADPDDIVLSYAGILGLKIGIGGELVIETASGELVDQKPFAYQDIMDRRVPVEAAYDISSQGTVRFRLGEYDPRHPLTIDPLLRWSSFLGGSSDDHGVDIASDSDGNLYVTGHTRSGTDFPVTPGAVQTTYGGDDRDVFVAKISSDGSTLLWCTYLGHVDTDYGEGGSAIAVDGARDVFVAGFTMSDTFPTTSGAYDTTYNGGVGSGDAFVAKISADGSTLLYSTFLGGMGDDWGWGIDVDTAGDIHVAGHTNSPNFPTTAGAFDQTYNGTGPAPYYVGDAFYAVISPDGNGLADLLYSTYIGGSVGDAARRIRLDAAGIAHISGSTESSNYPTTTNAYQTVHGGGGDAIVSKIIPLGLGSADLLYSTYLGGSGDEGGFGIDVNGAGDIYVAGITASSANFPTTAGAYQTTYGGGPYDAFASRISPSGGGDNDLLYSTFLGGSSAETGEETVLIHSGTGLELGCNDMVYLHAITQSSDFPVTTGTYDAGFNGRDDAALVKMIFAGNGTADLLYSTFIGGGGQEHWFGITATDDDNVGIICGATTIDYPAATQPSNYPTTVGVFQPGFAGGYEDIAISFAGFTDFGDAPNSYGTTAASNGPRHILGPLRLGVGWDAETDGNPTIDALGDDTTDDWPDDEDGVVFLGSSLSSGGPYVLPYVAGQYGAVSVTVTGGNGWLAGWFDWDQNGVFDNPSERMLLQAVSAGIDTIEFTVSAAALTGETYSRFRLAPAQVDVSNPTSAAPVCDGEVEDYNEIPVPVELSMFMGAVITGGVLLEWSTQSEEDNLGYHIYRSVSENADYRRITDAMIQGAGTSATEHHYSYLDQTAFEGLTNYYRLMDYSSSGAERSHGPIAVTIPLANHGLVIEPTIPNPVQETGLVRFSMPMPGKVRLVLYNLAGQKMRVLSDGVMTSGAHSVSFHREGDNGSLLSAGTYLLKLETPSGVASRRVVVTD